MKDTMTKTATVLLAALAVGVCSAATARPREKKMLRPAFDLTPPSGWSLSDEESAVRISGPADKNGLAAFIVVRYHPPEDKAFADAAAYLAAMREKPLYEAPGTKIGPATEAVVAGRKARTFVKDDVAYVPPSRMDTKEVPMSEEHFVVPAEKGFYVLMYRAPSSLFAKNRGAFKKVLAGFKPRF